MAKRLRQVLLLIAVCGLFVGLAQADSQVRIVRLSYINGGVQVDRGQGAGYEQALPNMPMVEGLKISTAVDGVAELEFEDGSTLRITPESEIELRQLSLQDDGATLSSVALLHGTAYVDFRKHKDDAFNLVLPDRNIELSHAVRLRAEVAQDEAELAVFSGELDITGLDQVLRVKKNETVTLDFTSADKLTLAKGIDPAPYDDWSNEREKYRERYASTIDHSNNMPAYGLADLAYYGDSFDLPGYGWVWQPYGIGYGWSPFSSGYWNFYPSTGWMWCSYAPWGWYPYRYGNWIFASGYGWVWRPGPTTGFTSWYPIPPVHGPSGFRPPVRPAPPGTSTQTIIAVGERPVHGPGHKIYDPFDPVLTVHDRNGGGKASTSFSSGHAGTSKTTSGGVSTFAPGGTTTVTFGADGDTPNMQHRVPGTIRDLRRAIDTPENESALGLMRSQDTYNKHLHKELEHQPAASTETGAASTASGTPSHHHDQPDNAAERGTNRSSTSGTTGSPARPHHDSGAAPASSHSGNGSSPHASGNSTPAPSNTGNTGGGAGSGSAAPSHSSGGASFGGGAGAGGGGASHTGGGSSSGSGGGGASHGGGRPPK